MTQINGYLFIGGPVDGQRLAVIGDNVNIPHLDESHVAKFYKATAPITPMPYKTARYTKDGNVFRYRGSND